MSDRGLRKIQRMVAPGQDSDPIVVCDEPADGSTISRGAVANGWAFSPAGIKEVSVWFEGQRVGEAKLGLERPDVAQAHPEWPDALHSGFRYYFEDLPETATDEAESVELTIVVEDGEGRRAEVRRVVRPVESPLPMAGSLYSSKREDLEDPLVQISSVQLAAVDPERLRGFALDAPLSGTETDVYSFEIAGWVLGQLVPAVAVEVHAEDKVLRRAPLDQSRADVDGRYPEVPEAKVCGFHTWIGVLGLEPGVELQVKAVLKDESRVRLAAIQWRHKPLRSGFVPTLQPLMLTTIGRAGTTWTMRLLSEHPKIVVHRWHPYELRAARYWMHMLKVLSEPKDPYQSAEANSFQGNRFWVGHNPFFPEPMMRTPGLAEWFGRTHIEELAAFCQRNAEACYQQIAASQGQEEGAVYFAEKHRADDLPWLFWELYPRAKEVFLVRDFRDVVSSMLAFNAKQGRRVFGRPQIRSDEEFARFVRNGPVRLVSQSWSKRRDRAHLIRYEDLIRRPEETLRGLLEYLDLDHDDTTISGMIDRAAQENPEMQQHRTSGEVSSSIGRWRQSLDPNLQETCRQVFGDVLEQFGYEV